MFFYLNILSSPDTPPPQPFPAHLHPPPPATAAAPPTAVLPTGSADDDFADFQAAPTPAVVKLPQIPAPVAVNNSTVTKTGAHDMGVGPWL